MTLANPSAIINNKGKEYTNEIIVKNTLNNPQLPYTQFNHRKLATTFKKNILIIILESHAL